MGRQLLYFIPSLPHSCPLVHGSEIRMAAVPSATIPLIPLLPGEGDESSQETWNQGAMLPAQLLPRSRHTDQPVSAPSL